jgi:YD repeat-containing protein
LLNEKSRFCWIGVFVFLLLASSAGPVIADPSEVPAPAGTEVTLPDAQDVSQGIALAEKEEREREEELATPAAVQEREESLEAFAGSDAPSAAAALLQATFVEQLEALDDDPARFLSEAKLVQPLGATAATVESEGNGQLMDGGMPVRTENEEGELRKVDLSLQPAGGGFETANALVDLTIGASAADEVQIGAGLSISQVGASEDSAAKRIDGESVLFADVGAGGDLADTDLLVAPIASGVELFSQLRSVESPETLRFHIDMPEGADLRSDGYGGAEVVMGEEKIATIPFPYAVDAQGSEVGVEMEVEGGTLVLHVAHREADVAYPLLVDPAIYEDWINPGTSWINGYGLNGLTNGAWIYTETGPWIESSTYCIYACWGGSGRGLFVSMPSGTQWEQQYGHWSYSAPNTASYLVNAWANPFVRHDHGCHRNQYYQPHDYVGMWYQGKWNRALNDQAISVGSVDIQSWGEAFILGIATGGGNTSHFMPCWRDVYVGGAVVWLDDWQYPNVQSVTGYPSGWIKGSTQFTLSTSAVDAGLGVQNVIVYPQGTAQVSYPHAGCNGVKASPCPTTLPVNFSLTGASFLEGERSASLNAADPTGKYSSNYSWTMRVDKTPPDITLSGQLAQETDEVGKEEKPPSTGDQLSLPVYNLMIKAEDGSTAPNPEPKDKRSGVKDIEVFLDGVEQEVPWAPQSCPVSSCSMTKTYKLILSKLTTAGKHTLEVLAVDQVGNKPLKRTIEFEYFPATGIKDEYVMHYFPLADGQGAEEGHSSQPELAVNVMNGNLVYRETDIDVEGTAAVDLELERYYNSMLPEAENTEWGDGWTLAQTPDLDPIKTGGSPVPNEAEIVDSSGAMEGGVGLPTEAGTQKFDPDLQAALAKKPSGGYELSDETGESATSVAFDETGQTEALLGGRSAKVDYSYEGGDLAEIEVSDPSTFIADPEELEIPTAELITAPTFARSIATNGSGDGQLQSPGDVAVDAQGNLWVVDKSNNRIQKLDPTGKYLAKFGSAGSGDGQFNRPTSIAITASGDLIVTDAGNGRVQRFSSAGAYMSKFGSKGTGNGQFSGSGPEGITIDSAGNIWVSDTYGGRVQKFNSVGAFVKVVGSKGSGSGQLGEPTGIDVDPAGNVWVADWQNNRVSVFNNAGEFLSQFGSAGTGNGQFSHPDAIEVDNLGNVWVGDQSNSRIQQFDLAAQFKGKFGSAGSGPGQFSFGFPMGIVADSKGHLWVTDVNNHRIQEWLVPIEKPTYISSFGSTGTGSGQLKSPGDVARGIEGNLWVVDKTNNRLQKFDPDGQFLAKFGSAGSGDGQFNRPTSIAIDRDGNLVVADADNNRIQKFSPNGEFLSKFGSQGTDSGQFNGAEGIAADAKGNIWVADTHNGRIQKFDEEGNFLKVVGSKGSGSGQLGEPTGIDVDPAGNVWVADWQNNRVSVFNNAGEFLSQFGSAGTGNGQFSHPDEIEIDRRGNVWVGDQSNNRVQRFDLAAQYQGQFGSYGTGQGQFSFAYPMGITTDDIGHIWVTDVNNHRIQRWQLGNYAPAATTKLDLSDGDPQVTVETPAGLVSSVSGNAAGEHNYEHSGDDLVSHDGPEGETKYTYDASGRMTKVDLPGETWGAITYQASDGRVKSVTVAPEGANPKTTLFTYTDEPRRTFVEIPGAPNVTYDIGEDGSVLKWWHQQQAPQFLSISGSLWVGKETEVETGDHTFSVIADSPEGIASIHFIANGTQLVDEKTCQQDPEKPGVECTKLENAWVTNTADLIPGILQLEAIVTDTDGSIESERFWVNVPYTPPSPPGAPAVPRFKDVLQFRENYGLEVVFPVASESELHERVFDLLHAWHSPQTSAGEVARASWERWGVPLRPEDVAEMEYREWFFDVNGDRIDQWAEATSPSTYAGYYIDHAAGGIMHIGFTQTQAGQLADLKASLPLVAGERLQVYSSTPAVAYTPLEDISSSVAQAVDSSATLRSLVTSQSTGDNDNMVHVGALDVAQVKSILDGIFGSNSPIIVEYLPRGEHLTGRFRNSGRMRAGDSVLNSIGNRCTAGFGTYDEFKVGGKDVLANFVLTAGHCYGMNEKVLRSPHADLSGPTDWREVGEVKRRAYGQPEPMNTDTEAIRIKDGGIVPRGIFGWGGDLIPTEPASKARVGNRVCFSGARTQVPSCGEIVARERNFEADGVRSGGYLVEFETPANHGDSGAPVWNPRTGASIGLVTGGNYREQTLVEPLLHPPKMNQDLLPGILHNKWLQPMYMKLGD